MTRVYAASVKCLGDDELFEKWLDKVPALRREKAAGFKNADAKKRSLGAGALLVCALRDYIEKNEQDSESLRVLRRLFKTGSAQKLRIAEEEHGKPFLPDFEDIHFSMSHSGDRVMCAVSDTEVGCDVEQALKRRESSRIESVSRYFTQAERNAAIASPLDFYRIWTLKESFMKLTGQGLRLPLDSFEVTPDPPKIKQTLIKNDIVCRDFGCIDGYQYACVSAGGHVADEITWVDLRQERENEGNTAESH